MPNEANQANETEDDRQARMELARQRELAARHAAEVAQDEQDRLRRLHWMRCPKCGTALGTVRLRGVAVDTCGRCGGMWLDAGELDQLTARDDPGLLARLRRLFGA